MREAGHDRQHGRPREAERVEILPVELRIAHRQIAAVDVRLELAPAAEALRASVRWTPTKYSGGVMLW